jgi:hypothetical protein
MVVVAGEPVARRDEVDDRDHGSGSGCEAGGTVSGVNI